MILKKVLFWNPTTNFLKIFSTYKNGVFLVLLNYAIWFFLAFISYLLVIKDANVFWQLLVATIVGELIEKYGKKHALWRRPMFHQNKEVPHGLASNWYDTGAFPSGHTTKAVFFFLFLLQYQIMNPIFYLSVTIPLIIFRVLVGFHYPIDIIGGGVIGCLIWLFSHNIVAPDVLNNFILLATNWLLLK